MSHLPLILASSSPYRRLLLDKLTVPYQHYSPNIDESHHEGESAEALVVRLAEAKAKEIAKDQPEALIIGSDQVAKLNDHIITKPNDHTNAIEQLEVASGKRVTFLTGLCLLNSQSGHSQSLVSPFHVDFRVLSRQEIEAYLEKEQPYDCAGSFKSEGLGITLFEKLEGDDPNALIGLPLIELVRMLINEGVNPLTTKPTG